MTDYTTIGDLARAGTRAIGSAVGTGAHAVGDFLYTNRRGLGIAVAVAAGMALYQGFSDPLPPEQMSQPNFVAPGQDFDWSVRSYWMGVAAEAMANIYLHPFRYTSVVAAGPVAQAVLRQVGKIRLPLRNRW